ncbi:(6-4) photolyase [uncultured Thiomicrorhabdus sp.]
MSQNQAKAIRHLCLVFGDQLDQQSNLFMEFDSQQDALWMAEVSDESSNPASSKQRTVLFLSAMRHFAQWIERQDWPLVYYSIIEQFGSFSDVLAQTLQDYSVQQIRCVLPGDYRVLQALQNFCKQQQIELIVLPDSHFIAEQGEFQNWANNRQQLRMEYWYRQLRKRCNILMNNGKPEGGKWNYDADNRKAFGKAGPPQIPIPCDFLEDDIVQQVRKDVEQYLPNLPGNLPRFFWPVDRQQALQALQDFIDRRLPTFGDYQDAMWKGEPWLFHSRISMAINLKLLHPMEVIQAAENAYRQGRAPLNAVEGFIRQILGWREYIRGIYWLQREQWSQFNALDNQRDLPQMYWDGKTQMNCMQQSLKQVLDYGYGHHIQRLMITGLYALLAEVEPQQIEAWYLAMYVDAVAWVEVPNTLGMSQFADGGILASKPYIASGNYIKKMSNYCDGCAFNPKNASGDKACPMTTLYWHFIYRHQDWLQEHPRLAMQVKHWHNKSAEEQAAILQKAEQIL